MSIEEKFHAAVDVVNSIPYDGTFEPSEELMLKFYAYQKQAIEGECREPKPFIWNTMARNKWNAWNELGDMASETAMQYYIEELSKVIEAMSYNEKIAKFIALVGSFYEIVSPEECDSLIDQRKTNKWPEDIIPSAFMESYKTPTFSDIYNIPTRSQFRGRYEQQNNSRYESIRPSYQNIHSSQQKKPESPSRVYSQSSLSSSSSSSSDISNFDLLSDISADDESHPVTERGPINLFKNKRQCKAHHFSTQEDLLILMFINLQHSMENICEKFTKLECLAEKDDKEKYYSDAVDETDSDVKWNWTGAALALLWPIIVEIALG